MKTPIVLQHDEKDCGAACIAMVAEYYGLKLPLVKCRNAVKVDNDGASMYGLIKGAEQIGLKGEALEGSYSELLGEIAEGNIKYPFVARIITAEMFEHYIVVYKITDKEVIIGDPGKGKVKYPIELFEGVWTGHIVAFEKTPEFKKGNERKGTLSRFLPLITSQKKLIAGVVAVSLFISFVSLVGSMVFEYIVNNLVYAGQSASAATNILSALFSNIHGLCIAVIVLYIFQGAVQVLRGYLLASMSKKIDIPLSMGFYDHLINLPISFFGTRKSGEIMSRFSDTSSIREAVSGSILTLIIDSLMAVFFGAYLCYISPVLFLITMLIMLSYAIIVFAFRKPIKKINQVSMESDAQMTSYLKESIDGIETVKAFGNEKSVYNKTKSLYEKMIDVFVKGSVTYSLKDALVAALASIGVVVLLWVGNSLCENGTIALGSMVTFYVILNYFISPITNLIEVQPTIQTAIVAAERLCDVLEVETENNVESGKLVDLKGDISFNDITFRYGYRKPVISNLSVNIPVGAKVAIVGESGSGKTTLMKLLMAFYQPESGEITVGNRKLTEFSPKEIRERIAYVSQNVFFFSDTVRENLVMGNKSITDEEIEEACKKAMADDFIKDLPMEYETVLSENASNLSGGQRQRLSIARALLRKPDIMILDEATSNLDTVTEQSIKNMIFGATKGLTTFIIAHRLSTIKNCDIILVMENGEIVESGTHDTLINANGRYTEYWKSNN